MLSTLMWVSNVFGQLQLADSTNIKISFGFSSFSELKKFLLLSLYWVFLFFSFWLWDLSSPPIHPAMETWSPHHWTARGFSNGYFLKEEWMIHIYIKNSHIYYNSYTSAFCWSWFFTCGLEKQERNGKQLQSTADCLQQVDSEVGVIVPVL